MWLNLKRDLLHKMTLVIVVKICSKGCSLFRSYVLTEGINFFFIFVGIFLDVFSLFHRLFLNNIGRHQELNPGPLV